MDISSSYDSFNLPYQMAKLNTFFHEDMDKYFKIDKIREVMRSWSYLTNLRKTMPSVVSSQLSVAKNTKR